jgi:hypothetical protein
MSKVEDLKIRYKNVRPADFVFFDEADFTPTKKYLGYMLKTWDTRVSSRIAINKNKIINTVKEFDELLPYITKKDIYDPYYSQLNRLIDEVNKAKEIKEQKTFIKEDHIIVINETETYLLLSPKTFSGSIKYGSNTKWCTASKLYQRHFNSYKKGFLVYLIDKTGKRKTNFEKIALYGEPTFNVNGTYLIYTATDASIKTDKLIDGGWSRDEVFEIDIYYRQFIKFLSDLRKAKEEVKKVIEFMKTIDLDKFRENLNLLKIKYNASFGEVDTAIKSFTDKILAFAISDLIKD